MSNLEGYNIEFGKVTDDEIKLAMKNKIQPCKSKASLRMLHCILKSKVDELTKA